MIIKYMDSKNFNKYRILLNIYKKYLIYHYIINDERV